jgi:hypothetical protein
MAAIVAIFAVLLAAASAAAPVTLDVTKAGNSLLASSLGWAHVRPSSALAAREVTIHIALAHPAETRAELLAALDAVSDPRSATYGKYLSREEVARRAQPLPGAEDAVRAWIAGSAAAETGITSIELTGTGDILAVTGRVPALAGLLGVELREWRHAASTAVIVRTLDAVALPPRVAAFVDAVYGVSAFPDLRRAPAPVAANPPVNAATIKALYSITDIAKGTSGASQAVVEFEGETYLPSDLAQFEAQNNLPKQPVRNGVGPKGFDKSAQVQGGRLA